MNIKVMSNPIYSVDSEAIEQASYDLVIRSSEYLIKCIYENQDIYDRPEVRVGLVVKILVKSNNNYSADLLHPVISDIETMLNDLDYLSTFEEPENRKMGLYKERTLINKFIEYDETISLNTLHQVQARETENVQGLI